MQINLLIISFVKMFFTMISIIYSIIKIYNYKRFDRRLMVLVVTAIISNSILYMILNNFLGSVYAYIICFSINSLLFIIYTSIPIGNAIILLLISIASGFITLFLASSVNFIGMNILKLNTTNQNILEYVIIGIIQIILINIFFRIKRFKDGFSFIQNNNNSKKLGIFISFSIIFISVALCVIYRNRLFDTILILGFAGVALIMIYWLQKSITKYYKERMKDRTVELQSEKLKEKDEIISNLNQELSNVLEINHKYNKRLSAMEKAIGNFGNKLSFNEEFAKEYSDILDSLNDLSKEYKQEFENNNILPKTNIFSIDNLLDYMKTEAIRNNIEFELEINQNINELIEKHISKNKLETLLGDHIADAITAINASDNSYKKIKVILGKDKEFYKISVLDTGIEFEIETLLKLGLERITTHKDSGGTGIGFMTTFETLKECKASLVIEEYDNENYYTKAVNIKFDNRNEYRINSVRSKEILDEDTNKRIIAENNG